ncbi:MAG: ammonium transporter [Planctomycetaceae bacterium]|nr:ammonium transporter [Planctomycetaceae bacterium]
MTWFRFLMFAGMSLVLLAGSPVMADEPSDSGSVAVSAADGGSSSTPQQNADDGSGDSSEDSSEPAWVSETPEWKFVANTVWVLLAAFLVFWMNAGFGCVEAGFCRSKNAVNILGKNFVVFGLSTLIFWVVGFAIMFGDGNSFMGTTGWFASGADNSPHAEAYAGVYSSLNWAALPLSVKFFFQLAFAATAATIVSGCVAERIHYQSYMLFVVVLVGLSYPITGHLIWGGGWLQSQGFFDFAGSTAVHSVGGWAGLIGILLLGARRGKYQADGSIRPIPGHNMGLAFLGGLILWMGWFGFNPGSFMAADAEGIGYTVVTTNTAAAAGLIAATAIAWLKTGKPDFSMTVNGALAGLVAITAGCSVISVPYSALVGAIGGVLVVFDVLFFDRLKLDDPVGALSVHLANGIWGTLAVGLFADGSLTSAGSALAGNGLITGGGMAQLTPQLIGIAAVGAFTCVISLVGWLAVRAIFGLRVSPDVEQMGLDRTEMGMEAYPENVLR